MHAAHTDRHHAACRVSSGIGLRRPSSGRRLLFALAAGALVAALLAASGQPATAADGVAGAPVLKGHIIGENGQPLPGVKVILWGGVATRWRVGETTTDAQGSYRFEAVKAGGIRDEETKRWDVMVGITLEHPTHVSADGEAWWDERIPGIAGHEHTRDFAMVRGGTIAGRMIDAGTGRPRAGFGMRFVRGKAYPGYARTDEKGEFASGTLFPGEYVVEANQDRFPDVTLGRVLVRPGETSRLTARAAEIVQIETRTCMLAPDALGTDVLVQMQDLRKQGIATGEDAVRLGQNLQSLEPRGFAHVDNAPRLAVFAGSTGRAGTFRRPLREEPAPAYWMDVTPRLDGEWIDADARIFIGTREGVSNSGRLVDESVRVRSGEAAALWMRATKEAPGDVIIILRFTVVPLPEEPAPDQQK